MNDESKEEVEGDGGKKERVRLNAEGIKEEEEGEKVTIELREKGRKDSGKEKKIKLNEGRKRDVVCIVKERKKIERKKEEESRKRTLKEHVLMKNFTKK